jgi:hypothetical protein
MHIGYRWESQKEIVHWEDQGVGGWTIIKIDLRKMAWIALIWLRIWTSGRRL